MTTTRIQPLLIIIATLLTMTGCDNAEQRRVIAMQQEVVNSAQQLVVAEAEARKELVALQRDLQQEGANVDHQRDVLEQDRREVAATRQQDPIIAEAIREIGLLLICLLPLGLCWFLLKSPIEPADDRVVAELLIQDLVASDPMLFLTGSAPTSRGTDSPPALPTPNDSPNLRDNDE